MHLHQNNNWPWPWPVSCSRDLLTLSRACRQSQGGKQCSTVLVMVLTGLQALSESYHVHNPSGFLHFLLQLRMWVRLHICALFKPCTWRVAIAANQTSKDWCLVLPAVMHFTLLRYIVSMHCSHNHRKQSPCVTMQVINYHGKLNMHV